jgi:hypothetical protein
MMCALRYAEIKVFDLGMDGRWCQGLEPATGDKISETHSRSKQLLQIAFICSRMHNLDERYLELLQFNFLLIRWKNCDVKRGWDTLQAVMS